MESGSTDYEQVVIVVCYYYSEGDSAFSDLKTLLSSEISQVNDNRYLLLWPLLGESPIMQIDIFLTTLASQAEGYDIVPSLSSLYRYLLDVNGANKDRKWPVHAWDRLQLRSVTASGLYASQPLLHQRLQYVLLYYCDVVLADGF